MGRKATGPTTLQGGTQAKRQMVVILETLAGGCSTSEAAERLGISHSRYYQLETRGLQGMLRALEPRPRGPKKTLDGEIRALKAEKKQLERELRQAQSLLRAASRSVGVKLGRKRTASKKKGTRKRRGSRGATVLKTLKEVSAEPGDGDGSAQRT